MTGAATSVREYPDLESGTKALLLDLRSREARIGDPNVVLVGGPTAAGKSRLTEALTSDKPGDTLVLDLDNYYLSADEQTRKYGSFNFSLPQALDVVRVASDFAGLLRYGKAVVPIYDMKSGQRTDERMVFAKARIIVCGIYSIMYFGRDSRFRAYVDAPQNVLYRRKLKRDVEERGIPADVVKERFENFVLPAIREHVLPQKAQANYIINNP